MDDKIDYEEATAQGILNGTEKTEKEAIEKVSKHREVMGKSMSNDELKEAKGLAQALIVTIEDYFKHNDNAIEGKAAELLNSVSEQENLLFAFLNKRRKEIK